MLHWLTRCLILPKMMLFWCMLDKSPRREEKCSRVKYVFWAWSTTVLNYAWPCFKTRTLLSKKKHCWLTEAQLFKRNQALLRKRSRLCLSKYNLALVKPYLKIQTTTSKHDCACLCDIEGPTILSIKGGNNSFFFIFCLLHIIFSLSERVVD